MRLITGGAFQGKLDYAQNILHIDDKAVVDGLICSWEELLKAKAVNHFHRWIDRMLREEQDVKELVEQLITANPGIVILVDELGCGIVPMEAHDRNYREVTGRICCQLAAAAEEVHRVICGIGTVIKHA